MRYEYPPLEKVRYCKVCRGPIPVHREDSEFCSTSCLLTALEEKDKEAKLGENQPITDDPPPLKLQRDCQWAGLRVVGGKWWSSEFWSITCPCGVTVKYGINEIPEVDTPHPCGNPDHWTVRYEECGTPEPVEKLSVIPPGMWLGGEYPFRIYTKAGQCGDFFVAEDSFKEELYAKAWTFLEVQTGKYKNGICWRCETECTDEQLCSCPVCDGISANSIPPGTYVVENDLTLNSWHVLMGHPNPRRGSYGTPVAEGTTKEEAAELAWIQFETWIDLHKNGICWWCGGVGGIPEFNEDCPVCGHPGTLCRLQYR